MAGTSTIFGDADRDRVNAAVREAESATSAEILPVVARSSGRYDRPEDWLRRLFTPHTQMREEVLSRAREVFFDQRIHHTGGASGVLLYVSLFEHMAAVIADQSDRCAV